MLRIIKLQAEEPDGVIAIKSRIKNFPLNAFDLLVLPANASWLVSTISIVAA